MKHINTLGIDLAKNVFQLHGVNKAGKCVFRKRVNRSKLVEVIAKLPRCLIGMEACGGAHHWARTFQALGHTVKLMAPQFVKPYVKSNKNDRNDSEAICEAVGRKNMRFVPIKTIEQQGLLMVHRIRELVIKQRTAQANEIRGLLAEYGIILPKGLSHIRQTLCSTLEDAAEILGSTLKLILSMYEQFKHLDEAVKKYDLELKQQANQDSRCKALLEIEGIGEICATAMVASIGDARNFKNGREVSAWIGLVPRQSSSGDKIKLLGISKRGDRYLRKLLIHGGRSAVRASVNKKDERSLWIQDKKRRCGENKAAVALANKNARIIWAMLVTGEAYRKSPVIEARVA